MKKRQYRTEPAQPAAHKGIVERSVGQLGDGLMAIPGGIRAVPAGTVDFFSRAIAMAKNPRAAAEKEMEREVGWKNIVFDLVGIFFILVLALGLIMAAGSLLDAKAAKQLPLTLVPAATLIVAFQLIPSMVLMVLLAAAALHLMAGIGGSKGKFERMAQLTAMVWAVVIPIILVVGIISSLAGLPAMVGYVIMNVYLIYALAKVMAAAYQMPFNRAVFMTFIYQLLMGVLSFVAAANAPPGTLA